MLCELLFLLHFSNIRYYKYTKYQILRLGRLLPDIKMNLQTLLIASAKLTNCHQIQIKPSVDSSIMESQVCSVVASAMKLLWSKRIALAAWSMRGPKDDSRLTSESKYKSNCISYNWLHETESQWQRIEQM